MKNIFTKTNGLTKIKPSGTIAGRILPLLIAICSLFICPGCENPAGDDPPDPFQEDPGVVINTEFSRTGLSITYAGDDAAAWKTRITAIKISSGETLEQTLFSGDYEVGATITVAKDKINAGLEGIYTVAIAATGFGDVLDEVATIDTKAPVITITKALRSQATAATLLFTLSESLTAGVGTGYFVTEPAGNRDAKEEKKTALNMADTEGSVVFDTNGAGSKELTDLSPEKVFVWVYAIDDYGNEGEAEAVILPYLANPTGVSILAGSGDANNTVNQINASNVEDAKVAANFAALSADSLVEFEIYIPSGWADIEGSVKLSVAAGMSTTSTETLSMDASAIHDSFYRSDSSTYSNLNIYVRARIYTTDNGADDGEETASSDWTSAAITKDATPPALSGGVPSGLTSSTGTTATVAFRVDEMTFSATTLNYWWVALPAATGAPSAAEVKAYNQDAPHGTSTAKTGPSAINISASITGLSADTQYKVYIVAEDAAHNQGELLTVSGVNPVVGATAKLYLDSNLSTPVEESGATLTEVLTWLRGNGTNAAYTIEMLEDDTIAPDNGSSPYGPGRLDDGTLPGGANGIQITLIGKDSERKIGLTGGGARLFWIGDSTLHVTLILGNNITLQGSGSTTTELIRVYTGGTLKMLPGSKIVGNTSSDAVHITGGLFEMTGGEISGNTSSNVGTVNVESGTFTMSGGTIKENEGISAGGVYSRGTVTMSGSAAITNNTATHATNGGGGVRVNGGSFTMSDSALIANNISVNAGGLMVSDGTATVQGNAVIKGNKATGNGGGVWVGAAASFNKTGNSIIYGDTDTTHTDNANENTATSGRGHAVYQNDNYYRDVDAPSGTDITVTPSSHIGVNSTGNPPSTDIIDPNNPGLISISIAKPEAGKTIANGTNTLVMGADGTGNPDVKWAKGVSAPAAGGTWYEYNSASLESGNKFAEHAVYHTKIVFTANASAKFDTSTGQYAPVVPAGASLVSATVNGSGYGNSITIIFSWVATTITAPVWTEINATTSTFTASSAITDIAYGNSTFVAVGASGKMAYSSNGTSWTAITGGTGTTTVSAAGNSGFGANAVNGIAYSGSKFVAVGGAGRMAHSENGTSWTGIDNTTSTFSTSAINDIAYGNSTFVAVGLSGKMARSSNGTSWTAITPGNASEPGDTKFGNSAINSISYGNGKFVAVGASGKMAYSTNGTTWIAISGGTGTTTITVPGASTFGANAINNVTYGGGKFVAAGASGVMACSEDGISWIAIPGGADAGTSTFSTTAINGIIYGGSKFVAVGASGRMAYSD